MEIILYIYFAINILMTTYFLKENLKWEGVRFTVFFSVICLLFGVLIGVFLYLFLPLFTPIFGWLFKEIRFQYIFRFTNYWDKILLDDDYSEEFRTKEEKLKRTEQMMKGYNKQVDRHAKLVIEKYATKKN